MESQTITAGSLVRISTRVTSAVGIFKDLMVFYSSYFTRKDKNIWVFGALRGQQYTDNAKYLFEYVNQHTDIQAIWISKNSAVITDLRSKGFQAYHEHSREALNYARRAKIAIVTHRGNRDKSDLPFQAFNSKTKIIQLWHGIPLKKIAYDDTVFSFRHDENSIRWRFKSLIKHVFFPFLNYVNRPSLILALSDETKDIFAKAFRTRAENVVVTGYPRNDTLLCTSGHEKRNVLTKVIYMPTFRGSVSSDFDLFLQYGFDVARLDTFLFKENMSLDIKLHPFNHPTGDLLEKLAEAQNISFLEHDDIYEILGEYNVLVTDFSSIYFDYLLLNRHIIFAPFDRDSYIENDREFYFDYDEVTPGPKAKDWNEIMQHLSVFSGRSSRNGSTNNFAKERESIKSRFHHFQDNRSTQRVYEAIIKIADQN